LLKDEVENEEEKKRQEEDRKKSQKRWLISRGEEVHNVVEEWLKNG